MRILDIFEAVSYGTFQDFQNYYKGDINEVDENLDLNLLVMVVANDKNPEEKLKIIKFLLEEGIDINYVTKKEKRNALHWLYFCNFRPPVAYALEVTKLLISYGIDLNATDKYNAIPLKYALTINKLPTADNKEMYKLLLTEGSDYNLKDMFGKSCLDYAKEYSWRNDFLEIIEEVEHDNR
ncbi:ankyrin repeat domain-containing protein [Carnobacterium gallinarum]|uniref:ankyrin repeat domain-containing protein n=1 Tax=Carnobacterium gallinarum TaxID=2749 RepID=UPI00055870BF|nr:ankyrin repeat domain-containing protein [Carnobacterium gallinarum]